MASAIMAIRRRANLTQIQLATALNVDQTTVSQYETGRTRPEAATLIKLLPFAKKDEAEILLRELCDRYGIDWEKTKPDTSERDQKLAAFEAEQAAIDAKNAELDAEEARLHSLEAALRGTVLITLDSMFGSSMAAESGLFKCVCITRPVHHIDFTAAVERLGKAGYVTIFRAAEAREMMRSAGYPVRNWIKSADPRAILFVKILPRGLDLLNKAIPPDPEVAV
jgi:transcriptional regulator with XRE-family HTH domain